MKEINDRMARIEERIDYINHELGVVIGKLDVLKYMVLVILGKITYDILTGG